MKKKNFRPVYCPRCGSLIGFQFEDVKMPKIEKVRLTIGDKKYPILDKVGTIPLYCHVCGYKYEVKRHAKRKDEYADNRV